MTNFVATDVTGVATFSSATILDGNTQYANVFFGCVVGDNVNGFYTSSPYSTTSVKFYSTSQFVLSETYSKSIAANQAFNTKPVVTVTVTNQNLKEFTLSAQIVEFDSEVPPNPELFTQKYMTGYLCNIMFPTPNPASPPTL